MKFYLGFHHPHQLAHAGVPLFVSHRRLREMKTLPRAIAPWALDSGGFTELTLHGRWTGSASDYARAVNRYRDEVGMLDWAAPRDWMCEPEMLKKTGLSVREHQRLTIESVLELRALGAPVVPVLQGWSAGEYRDHVEQYDRAGIDLRCEPVVPVGTMCRRQNTTTAQILMRELAHDGIRLHGLGFKATGLRGVADILVSSDSMAWSYHARREPPRPECRGKHINCANCLPFALEWRTDLLESLERRDVRDQQLALAGCWS
jgi:hypothetical protein